MQRELDVRVRWFLTDACNLACRQCNIGRLGSPSDQEIKEPRLRDLIDQFQANYVRVIEFLGGEPLLRPDFPSVLRYAKSRGLDVWLVTNGQLVDRAMADDLVSAGLDLVIVSIDGASAESHDLTRGHKGAFERATAAVRHLDDARRRLGKKLLIFTDCIVMRSNVTEIASIIRLAQDLHADTLGFLELLPTPRLLATEFGRGLVLSHEEYWDALEQVAALAPSSPSVSVGAPPRVVDYLSKRYGVPLTSSLERACHGGSQCFDFHHDGHLYPCGAGEKIFRRLFDGPEHDRLEQAQAAIDLKTTDFRPAVFSPAYDVFLRAAHDGAALAHALPEVCHGCNWSPAGSNPRCMPFCRILANNAETASRATGPALCEILDRRESSPHSLQGQ